MKNFFIILSVFMMNKITCYNQEDYILVQEQIENRKPVICRSGDLSHADLSNLNSNELSWADFEGTNLSQANLSHSHLSFANLKGTNCAGTIFYDTTFVVVTADNKTYFTFADFTFARILNCPSFAFAKLEGAINFVLSNKNYDLQEYEDNYFM